jgi:hypothetical protein
LLAAFSIFAVGEPPTKTFIIGQKFEVQEMAEYECLVVTCKVIPGSTKTLEPCRKKKGTEFWLTLSMENITRTVEAASEGLLSPEFKEKMYK